MAQRVLSDRLDGPVAEDASARADAHAAGCTTCAAFDAQVAAWRRRLRVAALEPPPDIAGGVRARLEQQPLRTRRARRHSPRSLPALTRAAAVFVVAFALGATAVGLTGPGRVEALELVRLVRAGQHHVQSVQAQVAVTEHGWHPQVPDRSYTGTLGYTAPETLALHLDDRTRYPDAAWRDNDVTVVVDEATAWSRGRVGCPVSALPDCAPDDPRTTVVSGREPFDATESVPLDLVVPVDSFARATTQSATTPRRVDGRAAVEVTVPVSQLQPLLDGVLAVGNWRAFHPTDQATVALDEGHGIPLRVEVTASPGTERERWAATLGYDDAPGDMLWSWEMTDVVVNAPASVHPAPGPPPQDPDVEVDRGFRPGRHDDLRVVDGLPDGMTPHRSGRVEDVAVRSWSDGRAWLRVRVHHDWEQDRLFGRDDGQLVRRVALPSGGVGYMAEGGDRLFLHGADADVEVTGSLDPDRLRAVAAGLGLRGTAVPRDWAEASSATMQDARRVAGRLLAPVGLADFVGPGVRVSADTVALSYAGNGDRGFVLTQAPGDVLTPPLDDHVLGVEVRGTRGRFTPRTGELEWVERGRTMSLRSATLPLPELLSVADRLQVHP